MNQKKELHHEVVRESQRKLVAQHRSSGTLPVCDRLPDATGGLRFATTTGYFLANPPVASAIHITIHYLRFTIH